MFVIFMDRAEESRVQGTLVDKIHRIVHVFLGLFLELWFFLAECAFLFRGVDQVSCLALNGEG